MKRFRRKKARKRGDESREVSEHQTPLDDVMAREGVSEERPKSRSGVWRGPDSVAKADPEDQVNAARSVS